MEEWNVTAEMTRHPLNTVTYQVDGDSADEALEMALSTHRESVTPKVWTVIGFWRGGEIVVAGVVAGTVDVEGGDVSEVTDEGCWASAVSAVTAREAEDKVAGTDPEADDYPEDEEAEADSVPCLNFPNFPPVRGVGPAITAVEALPPADTENTPNRVEDDPWYQQHDTVAEQTGEDR